LTSIAVLLFPAALPLLWTVFYLHRERLGLTALSRRGSLVIAFLVLQMLVDLVTETTSIGHHFRFKGVTSAWLVIDVVLAVVAWRSAKPGWPRLLVDQIVALTRGTSWWERILAAFAAAEFAIFVFIGSLYWPTNGDSLVYHLARVAHWVQNGSVAQYAAHYTAQIELSPLHEYNMAQLHILTGTDRLDGFVQLTAAVICVIGASEVARLLGGARGVQVLAAALAASIPSLVLEATSTQNNDFAAATIVGLLVLLLVWRPAGRFLPGAILIGGGLAVAAMTKGTLLTLAATTGLTLVAAQVVSQVRLSGIRKVAIRVGVGSAAALVALIVIAGPFFARNVQVFGSLTGPVTKTTVSKNLTAEAAASNVIRSTASNFQIGDGTGVEALISRTVLSGLKALYTPLHLDPRNANYLLGRESDAFRGGDFTSNQRTEDVGANPWDVLGVGLSLLFLMVGVIRGDRRLRLPLLLAVGIALAYVFFTGTARWSVFAVRYQTPMIVAWCPLMALVLARARRTIQVGAVLALVVLALPMLFDNVSRSVVHPTWSRGTGIQKYFRVGGNDSASSYLLPTSDGETAVGDAMSRTSCKSLGIANWILFEYPLWVSLRQHHWSGQISDVHVVNVSRTLADPTVRPCALVRQVAATTSYVSADPGMVTLTLADSFVLSVDAGLAGNISQNAPGFGSRIDGAKVMPGIGWVTTAKSPTMTRQADLYLMSSQARRVKLHFSGLFDTLLIGRAGSAGDALTAVPSGGTADVTMLLPPGLTTLHLRPGSGHNVTLAGVELRQ
jgi:hypothetical protein